MTHDALPETNPAESTAPPSEPVLSKTSGAASAAPRTGQEPEAARRAAAILEVLAGVRGPTDAAEALAISVNHYYLLERRALAGLVSACAPQPKGPRGPGLEAQVVRLERELEECRRECQRQAALVRMAQCAVGLPTTAEAAGPEKKGRGKGRTAKPQKTRRRRRPTVRALRAADALRKNSSSADAKKALEPDARGAQEVILDPSGRESDHDSASR